MFSVGDRIIMNEAASDEYACTRAGSTGVVLEVSDEDVQVDFDLLTGRPSSNPIFWVEKRHCEILVHLSNEERILNKIKQMETRWLAFQAKKAPCHV